MGPESTESLLMRKHLWVKLSYTILDVTEVDGSLVTTISDTSHEVAEDEAQVGCWFCNLPLHADTYISECIPEVAPAN